MTNYDRALACAIDRDIDDSERLTHFATVVANALDAIATDLADLRHPDIRWQPDDLAELLMDQLKAIGHEQQRLANFPVLVEDY